MIHVCERCGIEFKYSGYVKRCQKCRVTCEKCGGPIPATYRSRVCGSCKEARHRMIKCANDECNTLIRYNKHGKGFCQKHTDWSQHAKRLAEYNKRIKRKPPELRYKTERIPSIPKICIICGNHFLATPDAVKKSGGVICSRRCQGIRAAKLTPKKRTSIEIMVAEYLRGQGIEFIEQYPLCGVSLADMFIPSRNIAIYCDGIYWHNIGNRKERDAEQDQTISRSGVRVFRFVEPEIRETVGACAGRALL